MRVTLYLLYLSTSLLWWQVVAAIIEGKSSHTLRNNARCTWRHREGARNVYNTAIRRAFSSVCPCASSPADIHGCPRGVAPFRPPLTRRDTSMGHTGGAMTPSLHHASGCDTRSSLLFSPPHYGLPERHDRWNLLL